MDCILCEEPLGPDEPQVHNECGLRSAVGGIGHLLDHAHFCDTDPDAGLDFRTSALLVDILVRRMGLEMFTAAISPAPAPASPRPEPPAMRPNVHSQGPTG